MTSEKREACLEAAYFLVERVFGDICREPTSPHKEEATEMALEILKKIIFLSRKVGADNG